MTNKEIRSCIEWRVNKLNEISGKTYELDWLGNQCLLFIYSSEHCPISGDYGDASIRRTGNEMLAYLDGLLTGLTNIKY